MVLVSPKYGDIHNGRYWTSRSSVQSGDGFPPLQPSLGRNKTAQIARMQDASPWLIFKILACFGQGSASLAPPIKTSKFGRDSQKGMWQGSGMYWDVLGCA